MTQFLNLDVISLGDVVHADVHFGSRGHRARDFFAEEEIGKTAEALSGIDRIVIGDSHEVHAPFLEGPVDFERVVIAFLAELPRYRHRAHSAPIGMDVQVAPHTLLSPGNRYKFVSGPKQSEEEMLWLG
jgi:hypothetical protein